MNRHLGNFALRVALAASLALCATFPTYAFASPDDTGEPMSESSASSSEGMQGNGPTGKTDASESAQASQTSQAEDPEGAKNAAFETIDSSAPLPSSYYLTNEGLVTPVKLQSPWGDCWAFAIASAIESSILKKTADMESAALGAEAATAGQSQNTGAAAADQNAEATAPNQLQGTTPVLLNLNDTIDISERAIAWLAHEVQSEESAPAQAGEGFYLIDDDYRNQLSEGSFEMIESQLVARQSLVSEELVPYQYNDYDGWPEWYKLGSSEGASDDARTRDWSVDEAVRTQNDIGWRVSQIYKLSSPAIANTDYSTGLATYEGYDAKATDKIKHALMDVGAVAVAIDADENIPSEVVSGDFENASPSEHFTYSTWSQYDASTEIEYTHAVTIVGWDDSYNAANFAGTESGMPPGNGAWLCKNNWGSDALYASLDASGDSPHWGIPAGTATGAPAASGEDSEASGFFWLSYYDHTIHAPVAFDVTSVEGDFDNLYQYDYLGAAEYTKPAIYEGDVWVANVFTAQETELLEAVSAQTFRPADDVEIDIVTLPPDVNVNETTLEDAFLEGTSVYQNSYTFEDAGIHKVKLDEPVLVTKGEKFVVAEKTDTTDKDASGVPYEGTYLNLELSYNDALPGYESVVASKAVANEGETLIGLPDSSWIDATRFAEWYKGTSDAESADTNVTFGNALVKAFTNRTSFAESGQLYELARLQ